MGGIFDWWPPTSLRSFGLLKEFRNSHGSPTLNTKPQKVLWHVEKSVNSEVSILTLKNKSTCGVDNKLLPVGKEMLSSHNIAREDFKNVYKLIV